MSDHEAGQPDLAPLLSAAARGDAAAWREIVSRYARRVYALAKSRCRDADVAEEITQSVFATVAVKVGSGEYEEQGKFESWLFRVVMNRVRDHARRKKRRPQGAEAPLLTLAAPEGPAETDRGMLARLREAMEQLSEADREIVELRHHGEMSFRQMADLLNEPLGTLLARHHRALKKLKEMMERAEVGESTQAGSDRGEA